MKKTVLISCILVIAICLAFSACTFGGGGDPVSLAFHEKEILENIETLAKDKGVKITLSVTEEKQDESGEKVVDPDSLHTITYGARNNVYYYCDKNKEYYYDFSSPLEYTSFMRDIGSETWTSTVTVYSGETTEEKAREEFKMIAEEFFTCITSHIAFEGESMVKSSATYANRNCDKYSFSMGFVGVKMSYSVYVDAGTGACLGIDCDVSAFKETSDVDLFQCTEFSTEYAITLPEIISDAADDLLENN